MTPAATATYELTQAILDETWEMLRQPGQQQLEAVVLWIGRVRSDDEAVVLAPIFPYQIAYRSLDGLAVEVPQDALTQLIGALPTGMQILIRVHSHPGAAYHSSLDDRNLIIGHEGAVSIVVPYFATGAAQLSECSVNQLQADGSWSALGAEEVRERFRLR